MTNNVNEFNQTNFDIYGIIVENVTEKVYSPAQIACGGLAGPIGVIYFLYCNFATLGQEDYKNKTLKYGALVTIAGLLFTILLPAGTPSFPITLFYMAIAKFIADEYQMSKVEIIESDSYEFHSNQQVFKVIALCTLGNIAVVAIPTFLAISL